MQTFASALIDKLGGTTEVADLMEAAPSTVHRMRRQGTPSRLNHLRRVAHMERPAVDVDALAREHGIELRPLGAATVTPAAQDPVPA